jgi:hypothetical protein
MDAGRASRVRRVSANVFPLTMVSARSAEGVSAARLENACMHARAAHFPLSTPLPCSSNAQVSTAAGISRKRSRENDGSSSIGSGSARKRVCMPEQPFDALSEAAAREYERHLRALERNGSPPPRRQVFFKKKKKKQRKKEREKKKKKENGRTRNRLQKPP